MGRGEGGTWGSANDKNRARISNYGEPAKNGICSKKQTASASCGRSVPEQCGTCQVVNNEELQNLGGLVMCMTG